MSAKSGGLMARSLRSAQGADLSIESAGVVPASDDPPGVVSVRTLSMASYRKMLQNLG
jgi:cation transport ATPase